MKTNCFAVSFISLSLMHNFANKNLLRIKSVFIRDDQAFRLAFRNVRNFASKITIMQRSIFQTAIQIRPFES